MSGGAHGRRVVIGAAAFFLWALQRAHAHSGDAADTASAAAAALTPTLDLWVLAPLMLAAGLYGLGLRSAWRRAGIGRGVARWQALCYGVGFVGLLLSLVWPLDALGEQLFSAHMAQHLVLMNLAAPLLVLGAPLQVMMRPLPPAWQHTLAALVRRPWWRTGWHWLSGLAVATLLQMLLLWSWHTPRGVTVALENNAVHIAMHATLLAAALLFWTAVFRPVLQHGGQRQWPPLAALAATLKLNGIISITLMLQGGAAYLAYGTRAAAWGLSPAADEQLGWGLMMLIGSFSYIGAAIALLLVGFARLDASVLRPSRAATPSGR
jgi:putative membrane protein